MSLRALILFLFSFAVCYSVSSCKDPAPPKGTVIVLDSLNVPVSGATVRLTSTGYKGPGTIKGNKTTDSRGKANFEFELPAILDIFAYKVDANGDSLTGAAVLKLEEGETVEQKVTIR